MKKNIVKNTNNYNVGAYCNTPLQMIILAIVLMLILPSCSGGGGGGGTSGVSGTGGAAVADAGGNGNLYMRIAWPDAQREGAPQGGGKYIPSTATKITIDILGAGLTSTQHYEYARPESGQTTVNITLPVGSKTAEIRAVDSGGNTLSYSQSSFTVTAGQVASVSANLGVSINDTGFIPSSITVAKGTTLQFVNNGAVQHSVTEIYGAFNSGSILPGTSWSNTFNTAGTFYYTDTYNPALTGTLIVSEANTPPSAPSGLSAVTASSSQINLSWTRNSSNETGFKIERKTGSAGTYEQIATVGAGVTSYNNTGLGEGANYYYRVRAYNEFGNSNYSNESNAVTTLPAPSGLSAIAASSKQINLAWTDNSTNETGFKIERKTGLGGTYAQIATVGAGVTAYNNSNISQATNYYYRIRAYNADTDSDYSDEANATTSTRFLYAANFGSGSVSVINTATNTLVTTTATAAGAHGVAITPNNAFVYAANNTAGNVSVINTSTNLVIATIASGNSPNAIGTKPDGSFVYVTNFGDNNVKVINTATNTVTATVNVGGGPHGDGIPFTPDGLFAYVSNWFDNTVSVINTATNTVTATVAVGVRPVGIDVTPDGNFAYVANNGGNNVSIININTNTVIGTVAVGTNPDGVAASPLGDVIYVANNNSNNVSVISTATNTVIATIAVGTTPKPVVFSYDGAYAYVGNITSNNVSVIDTALGAVITSIASGGNDVRGLAIMK